MGLRLTKVDEYQFLTCLKHQVSGNKVNKFKKWQTGDNLGFIVGRTLAGLADVAGSYFYSCERMWDDGVFPHRVPLKFTRAMLPENRPPILGAIRDALTAAWGPNYGLSILNQQALPENLAQVVKDALETCHNDLTVLQENLEHCLAEARGLKEAEASKGHTRKRAAEEDKGIVSEPETQLPHPPETEPLHAKAQSALVQLGKATGCSVWIPASDHGHMYNGRALGDGCLGKLPALGLSPEAVKRISFIDVLWLRQAAPICAFEVEVTTSIYSGLLRMSDLLALVPALKMKLFIVAPKERQAKVETELVRPTFRKIGLSEYCRFIADDALRVTRSLWQAEKVKEGNTDELYAVNEGPRTTRPRTGLVSGIN